MNKDFVKETAPELAPYIEGNARSGRWERAVELSLLADRNAPKVRYLLCQLWDDVNATTLEDGSILQYDATSRKFITRTDIKTQSLHL